MLLIPDSLCITLVILNIHEVLQNEPDLNHVGPNGLFKGQEWLLHIMDQSIHQRSKQGPRHLVGSLTVGEGGGGTLACIQLVHEGPERQVLKLLVGVLGLGERVVEQEGVQFATNVIHSECWAVELAFLFLNLEGQEDRVDPGEELFAVEDVLGVLAVELGQHLKVLQVALF